MPEIRRAFTEELDTIEAMLAQMGALVVDSVNRVTEVLLEVDLDGAQQVIDADDELDLLTVDLEERVYRVMALQNPVASDLRLLVAAVKLGGEIERSGDLVTNIAKGVTRIARIELDHEIRGLIARMGERAGALMHLAVSALSERDAERAGSLAAEDDVLDQLHAEFVQQVFRSHDAGTLDVQQAVQLCLVGRFYERIGDHAVNVGERIHFVVTGWLPEHDGAERARRRHERHAS
ncbi:MAG: phosphate signaling complex protein PhoU [Actinomycetota bacterium]